MRAVRTARSPAQRLLDYEREDRRLSARMHRDTKRREILTGKMRELRCGFRDEDAREYEARRRMEERL